MSELPDLPPVVRRRRPLPPGGLEAAMASGARKRNRVLAVAGGTTTALVAVLALTVTLPGGGGPDSLGIADRPEPEANGTVPDDEAAPEEAEVPADVPTTAVPPTTPTATPADPGPAPSAAASAPAAPGASAGRRTADNGTQPGPATNPTQPPAAAPPPPASRPAYREDTDEDAPGTAICSGMSAGSCVHGSNSGRVARRGEQVRLSHLECSGSGTADTIYSFSGGQEKELVVTRDGSEVFRFSSTVRYVEGAHQRRLRGGRCIEWTGRWDQVSTDGKPVPAGTYELMLTVEAERAEPEGVPQEATAPYRQTTSLDVTIVD